jgi:methionyl aminopeptidase
MIELKNASDIKAIEKSSRIVSQVLTKLKEAVSPGIGTDELDMLARKLTKSYGARPAFLGYRGYPASVCISINQEVVHGIPSKSRKLNEGDIAGIDFGIECDGFFGDATITVAIGKVPEKVLKLIRVTEEALYKGIDQARPGNHLGDISSAIQKHAESNGFSIVRDFTGHGIGRHLHEDPMIPNFGNPGQGPKLQAGMVFAIEPMVNEKGYEVEVLEDEWTVVTVDGGLSAHFEHTVAVTENGPVILSRS